MKSYTIRLNNAQHTVLATSPRKALWLATQCRAISNMAWAYIKDGTTEGHYGPLSITRNCGIQMPLMFSHVA
jgi:hypothetical protein